MILTKSRQKFVKVSGTLIAIQGVVWFILSVVGIVAKNTPSDKVTKYSYSDYTKYSDYLARIIYDDFMQEGVVQRTDYKVIRPSDFEVFLWIYAILSALWIVSSLDLVLAVYQKKLRQSYIVLVLGVIVISTSIIDFVFFSLLARDFSTCPFDVSTTTSTEETTIISTTLGTAIDCQVADGIVMSLVARGYVLWLINVIIGIHLITIAAKVSRDSKLPSYNTGTIPRVKMQDGRKPPSSLYGDEKDRSSNGTPLALNRNTYF